ncbi:class A beta-lactamase-related serine hydrolase [Nocardia miyunensis]|uniref:class A beta-lactamase-related serine hydrolase n=1 Tax=Nocardia miyunensis TaxID=282684 RepID=UPI001FDEA3C3|nr:class A beta-lactamase-related serine hydrolase [Nocardia miyunensis]
MHVPREPIRWRRSLGAAVYGLTLLAVAACSTTTTTADNATLAPIPARPSSATSPGPMVALPGTLAADFASLLPTLGGHAGMAIMAVGGDTVTSMGDWTAGPAWSTMKVPLTLAVLNANGNTPSYAMSAAVTESDNSAADSLWQSLGTADQAAQAVQKILKQGGDSTTKVPSNRSRPDYSAFGQAVWSLADQTRFAAHLPCLPNANTVTDLMGKVVPGQQWGLGHLDNVVFKGGWGPDPAGNYLVRQFGLVTTSSGQMAVAIAAQANSGGFDDGTTMLSKIAPLITKHLNDLPTGSCADGH